MPKYKSPDGVGINIGGEQFDTDSTGCITVPNDNYHTLLTPIGFELQPSEGVNPDPIPVSVTKIPVATAEIQIPVDNAQA